MSGPATVVSGAELLVEALQREGADTIFTMPGGPIQEICRAAYQGGMRVVLVRHEQAATFAAQAYSYMGERIGVAVVVHGVGMTNGVTGLLNARDNGWPFLLVGGASARRHWGRGDFQELKQVELARPITKWAECVDRVERVPEHVSMAFRHMLAGRPGPAYLDMPEDIIRGTVDRRVPRWYDQRFRSSARPFGDPAQVAAAADLLRRASRPVMILGKGIRWSQGYEEVQELAARDLPVVPMPMARGVIPDDDPMCVAGARGLALGKADVILCVAARFNWMLRMGVPRVVNPEAKVIQIDIEAAEIGSNRAVDVGIVGDARAVLRQILDELGAERLATRQSGWYEALAAEREENRRRTQHLFDSDEVPIKPHRFFRELAEVMGRDAIVTVDGEIIMTISRMTDMHHKPGQRMDTATQGCIGTGVPFAIGAQLARPDKRVFSINGDAAFGLNAFEMETAVRVKAPVIFIVLNNDGIGGRLSEEHSLGPGWKGVWTFVPGIRYEKVMEAFGGYAEHVERPEQIRPALERALASGRAACINVAIDPFSSAIPGVVSPYL